MADVLGAHRSVSEQNVSFAKLGLQNERLVAIIGVMYCDGNEDIFAKARRRMVDFDLTGRAISDDRVIEAMSNIRREEFVQPEYRSQAYRDGPLPIGMGQTISQPYIVALMTQQLKVTGDCEVLEIGTGCGYQTAVLSMLAKKIYTIERLAELSQSAQAVLGRLGFANVQFHIGDGSCGWPEKKIFDRIMITAAVPKIPEPLAEQLAEGGLMVVPVGGAGAQNLMLCTKKGGQISRSRFCDVRFVKLLGKYAFEK